MMRLLPVFLIAVSGSSFAAVDYSAQIKPLLQAHCVKCHGATTQKARLRLDTAAAVLEGGGRGTSVIPGKAEESLLYQAIAGTHAEIAQMPYKRGPLDSIQIALLKQWITEGAKAPANEKPSDDRHWAYVAPKKAAMTGARRDENPIDFFIHQRLTQEGLKPSPEAVPETLVRRVSLDLTGLPPSPDEVAAFNPSSYAATVDKLLGSPHYGERWGRWWLDQARYADSNGYSIDAPRSIWPYRD